MVREVAPDVWYHVRLECLECADLIRKSRVRRLDALNLRGQTGICICHVPNLIALLFHLFSLQGSNVVVHNAPLVLVKLKHQLLDAFVCTIVVMQ